MQNDFTDITVIMDRSGSMQGMKSDAEGGIAQFIADQKKAPGRAVLTLAQFDTEIEFVHTAKPVGDIPPVRLTPRGSTALLDAIGTVATKTGERLAAMNEADRPGLVVIVIVTDGEENASREYTNEAVKKLIDRQQTDYKWQFVYIGANQDAFKVSSGMGLKGAAANYTPSNAKAAYASASSNVARMREAKTSGGIVMNRFTEDEKTSMTAKS